MGTSIFTGKGTVSTLIIKKLDEGQTLEKTQLTDLLRRSNNCDFVQQVLDGLEEGQPLYLAIVNDVKTTGLINTKLPNAKRYFINGGVTLGHSSLNIVNDVDDPTAVEFKGRQELIASVAQMKDSLHVLTNETTFDYTKSKDVLLNLRISLGIYDGSAKIGSGHRAPTWRFSNSEDNAISFGVDLVLIKAEGGEEIRPMFSGTFFKENIQNQDIFSLYGTQRVKIIVPTMSNPASSYSEPVYTGFYLRSYRSPYVATYGVADRDKMGFIMEGSIGASTTDTSNYLDIIEMSSIGD